MIQRTWSGGCLVPCATVTLGFIPPLLHPCHIPMAFSLHPPSIPATSPFHARHIPVPFPLFSRTSPATFLLHPRRISVTFPLRCCYPPSCPYDTVIPPATRFSPRRPWRCVRFSAHVWDRTAQDSRECGGRQTSLAGPRHSLKDRKALYSRPQNAPWQGGGEIEVRNFSQFSAISQFFAIFRNFSQFSAIFRNFPAIFHTSRFSDRLPTLVQNNENFFFLVFHTLSNVAKSPEPGIAQLIVPLHCSSRVLGSNPVGHNMVTFAFLVFLPSLFWSFSCLHVCMFACACPMCQRLQSNGAYTSVAMLLI